MRLSYGMPAGLALVVLAACGGGAPPGVVVLHDAVVTEGTVNAEYLSERLNALSAPFEACYSRALGRNREAEGTLELELTGRGAVITPQVVANGTGDDSLAACVTRAVEGIALGETTGEPPLDFTASWEVEFRIGRRSDGS